jgi:hypothetical protein
MYFYLFQNQESVCIGANKSKTSCAYLECSGTLKAVTLIGRKMPSMPAECISILRIHSYLILMQIYLYFLFFILCFQLYLIYYIYLLPYLLHYSLPYSLSCLCSIHCLVFHSVWFDLIWFDLIYSRFRSSVNRITGYSRKKLFYGNRI